MFGILEERNTKYIGIEHVELRSGKGATSAPAVSIFAPIHKRNDLEDEKPMKIQREETLSRKSNRPEYVLLMPSQLRGNIWTVHGRPDMINRIAHPSVEQAILGIIYQENTNNTHVDMEQCPRNEVISHGRGMGATKSNDKWHRVYEEPTYYHVRWMGEIATHRDHLVRTLRDLEDAGEIGANRNQADVRCELALIDMVWRSGEMKLD